MDNTEILTNFEHKRVLYGTDFDDHATRMVYDCNVCHDYVGVFTKKDAVEHFRARHLAPEVDHQAILTKAIQKALDNGWLPKTPDDATLCSPVRAAKDVEDYWDYDIWPNEAAHIIFNHAFAKALWGEKEIQMFKEFGYEPGMTEDDPGDEYNIYDDVIAWQYHLQQMVIAQDPIKYLGEHLDAN